MSDDGRALLDALLRDFAKSLGIPELKTDAQGVCMLMFDKRIEIDIMADGQRAVLWRTLGRLPEGGDGATAMRRLLEANLFWKTTKGASLSLMPASDEVVMAVQWPLPGMSVETLRTLIETLVETSEELTGLLRPVASSIAAQPGVPLGIRA